MDHNKESYYIFSLPSFLQILTPFTVLAAYPEGQWEKQKSRSRVADSLYILRLHLEHFKLLRLGQRIQFITRQATMEVSEKFIH